MYTGQQHKNKSDGHSYISRICCNGGGGGGKGIGDRPYTQNFRFTVQLSISRKELFRPYDLYTHSPENDISHKKGVLIITLPCNIYMLALSLANKQTCFLSPFRGK